MIEIDGLSCERGGAVVLDDVSLCLPRGGLTAIIGPNGAGKSTLLHAIAGLIEPGRGQIRVEGTNIHRAPERERALLLSLLTQSPGAVPRLSVRELVAFGRWPHHRGRPGADDRAVVEAAMARFDLHTLADRPVEALSGGQRQRAFVAMAFAQTTPWMLLDEPLAALDPKYTRDIMERLRDLPKDGPSVVLVLHDLSVAAQYADHCVCLKDGRLVASGPWRQTITSGVLSDLYETPIRITEIEGRPVVLTT